MQVSNILESIDLGAVALPEFQRGYVWQGKQVKGFMQSLYRKHPVGGLLVWTTQSDSAPTRGDGQLQAGHVKLLLDGQQRITTLYGIIKGRPPRFFDGDPKAFTRLMFHLEDQTFEFYGPVKMRDDPYWINVTDLMQQGLEPFIEYISGHPALQSGFGRYMGRLNAINAIKERVFHIEEVNSTSLDDVVEIFNNVNSGGTKLSKGDLALARVCAGWTDARDVMRRDLDMWEEAGYSFNLEWLLRNVTAVLTGQSLFDSLEDVQPRDFQAGLETTERAINYLLNVIAGRLGLDHDRVLGGRYAFPVMSRYIVQRRGRFANAAERDKLLYWYVQSFLWGRYGGSTESVLAQDLRYIAANANEQSLDALIDQLRTWRGDLVVRPENFAAWGRGARFYPFLYLLTRTGAAQDLRSGIPLKDGMLGRLSRLQVHHIFPKAVLYRHNYSMAETNSLANFCFLTQDTNLVISDTEPRYYFPEIESRFPGALESQWIPMDEQLWHVENYPDFLAARQELLAQEANRFLNGLLQTPEYEIEDVPEVVTPALATESLGAIISDDEEMILRECNDWVIRMGLSEGEIGYELIGEGGELQAVIDLAWPEGVQQGLSEPVALLIDEADDIQDCLNQAGYRYFTSVDALKVYVNHDILGVEQELVAGD